MFPRTEFAYHARPDFGAMPCALSMSAIDWKLSPIAAFNLSPLVH